MNARGSIKGWWEVGVIQNRTGNTYLMRFHSLPYCKRVVACTVTCLKEVTWRIMARQRAAWDETIECMRCIRTWYSIYIESWGSSAEEKYSVRWKHTPPGLYYTLVMICQHTICYGCRTKTILPPAESFRLCATRADHCISERTPCTSSRISERHSKEQFGFDELVLGALELEALSSVQRLQQYCTAFHLHRRTSPEGVTYFLATLGACIIRLTSSEAKWRLCHW